MAYQLIFVLFINLLPKPIAAQPDINNETGKKYLVFAIGPAANAK